ncbi:MAG: SET domain-containing protein [Panacagrimonas sp.]
MIHPHTELRRSRPHIGHGLFATQLIPRGTVTWVRDALDQVIAPAAVAGWPTLLSRDLERYTWRNADGNYVLCWDLARFVNHACNANCLRTAAGFEIAVRDIQAGEEMTNDYADLGLHEGERLDCRCGAERCRGVICIDDLSVLRPRWQAQLATALADLGNVPQPLWSLLPAGSADFALSRISWD